MTREKIKQKAHEFIDTQLNENPDWFDYITDSWIYDAENWFCEILEKEEDITLFTDDEDYEYTDDVKKYVEIFWGDVQDYFKEKYTERYGSRDAKYCLHRIGNDIKTLLEKYNSIKHHFKKFNAYTNAVTYQFEELVKCLQLLDNIENGKVESLKEKGNNL